MTIWENYSVFWLCGKSVFENFEWLLRTLNDFKHCLILKDFDTVLMITYHDLANTNSFNTFEWHFWMTLRDFEWFWKPFKIVLNFERIWLMTLSSLEWLGRTLNSEYQITRQIWKIMRKWGSRSHVIFELFKLVITSGRYLTFDLSIFRFWDFYSTCQLQFLQGLHC